MSVITKRDFAPARAMVEQKLKQVMGGKIKIAMGAWATDNDGHLPRDKRICIMEATAYILGYDKITDSPPCTSSQIRHFMIALNDSINSDRKRAQLKKVIPDIVNTAPTRWVKQGSVKWVLRSNEMVPEYKAAERTRKQMISDFVDANFADNGYDWESEAEKLPMRKYLDLIRALADVAKFDGAALKPETQGE